MANKWFQDGNPASFKIQVLYNEIPSFVKTRLIDTPFRFSNYEDAMTVGQEIFNGVQFRIVGSSDKPHWQSTPLERATAPEKLKNKPWYDIYGVAPVTYKQAYQTTQKAQKTQSTEQPLNALKKLKPLQTTEGVQIRKL